MKENDGKNAISGEREEREEREKRAGLDEEVCQWCALRGESACWMECMPDRRFKYLKPRLIGPEEDVEPPFDFLNWVNENPMKIRALVYLMIYYYLERQRRVEITMREILLG